MDTDPQNVSIDTPYFKLEIPMSVVSQLLPDEEREVEGHTSLSTGLPGQQPLGVVPPLQHVDEPAPPYLPHGHDSNLVLPPNYVHPPPFLGGVSSTDYHCSSSSPVPPMPEYQMNGIKVNNYPILPPSVPPIELSTDPLFLSFAVTPDEVHAYFEKWKSSLWFAPPELKTVVYKDVKMAYCPYWRASTTCKTTFKYIAESTPIPYVSCQPHTNLHFCGLDDISGIPVHQVSNQSWDFTLLTHATSATELESLRFPMENVEILKNFVFQTAWERYGKSIVQSKELDAVHKLKEAQSGIPDSSQSKVRVADIEILKLHARLVYVPIYVGRYEMNNETYHFVLNGQTGDIRGTRPYIGFKRFFTRFFY